MPFIRLNQIIFGSSKRWPSRKPTRLAPRRHLRALALPLATFTFFLGQTVSIPVFQLKQLGDSEHSYAIFASAFAAGRGSSRGSGNSSNSNSSSGSGGGGNSSSSGSSRDSGNSSGNSSSGSSSERGSSRGNAGKSNAIGSTVSNVASRGNVGEGSGSGNDGKRNSISRIVANFVSSIVDSDDSVDSSSDDIAIGDGRDDKISGFATQIIALEGNTEAKPAQAEISAARIEAPAEGTVATAEANAKAATAEAKAKTEAAAEATAKAKAATAEAKEKRAIAAEARAKTKEAKTKAAGRAEAKAAAKAKAAGASAKAKTARAEAKAKAAAAAEAREKAKAAEGKTAKAEARAKARTAKEEAKAARAEAKEAAAAAKTARAEAKEAKEEAKAARAEAKEAREAAKTAKEEAKAAKAAAKAARAEAKAARAEAKAARKAAKAARDAAKAARAKVKELLQRAIQKGDVGHYYSLRDVLAQNLSRKGLERVQALGFSVHQDSTPRNGDGGQITRMTTPSDMTVIDAMELLERELPDEIFHLNAIYRIYYPATQNGVAKQRQKAKPKGAPCSKDRCYGREIIHWQERFVQCTRKLKIGIIDTKVDIRHEAFAGRNIRQKAFLPEGRQLAESEHGTGIAALLAGRPDSNTPGLVSDSEFYIASIFYTGDDGSVQTDTHSLMKALEWMKASGVQFVNMSFAGPEDSLTEPQIDELRPYMAFAAAAGNEGLAADPSYPAAYPQVIAVTAVDKKLKIYPSANRGDYIDVAAPGVNIWTALPNSQEGYQSGTSFAVPFMTAMLALQPPEALSLPKNELLGRVMTVRLEDGSISRTYGRGLLQAPNECPNALHIANDGAAPKARKKANEWAPVQEASFRNRKRSRSGGSVSHRGGRTSPSGRSTSPSGGSTSPSGGSGSGHGGGGSGSGSGSGSGHGGRR